MKAMAWIIGTIPGHTFKAVKEEWRMATCLNLPAGNKKTPAAYQPPGFSFFGAGNGIRTRDFDLGKMHF
jgi:hypothetical protein